MHVPQERSTCVTDKNTYTVHMYVVQYSNKISKSVQVHVGVKQ